MVRLKLLLIALGVLAMTLTSSPATAFDLNCAYSHSLPDDPIVYPKQPGASHLHDFFGNKTTNAFTTVASGSQPLIGKPTTCQNTNDHAAYWAPAAYINGNRLLPMNIKAYYVRSLPGTLVPYPTDLRMIAGNSHATGPMPTSVLYFGCGSGTGISKQASPPNCSTVGGKLQIHVIFPECGTGALTSPDHLSHVAYATKGVCPSGFPVHFPQLQVRLNYDVLDARGLSFSSGAYWTCHADFWNAWTPAELARLVSTL